MNNYHAIKKFDSHCSLGESPLWHQASSTLFWLDINQQLLFIYQQGQAVQQVTLSAKLSFIAETNDPQLLIGLANFGVVLIDIRTYAIHCVQEFPANEGADNRANDGGISSKGYLVFGTMDNNARDNSGSIYCFDGALKQLADNILVPNLFAFINDKNFFFADSLNNQIELCTLNKNNKLTRNKWVSTAKQVFPDGGCLDEQGGLWSAQWGASQVVRYSMKDKTITDIIHLPEQQPTSCCFIGENLDQLFITTAGEGLPSSQFGNCYICELPYNGQPIHHFDTSFLRKHS